MNKLTALASADTKKEVDGIPVVFCPDGVTKFPLVLARAGGSNNAYHKALAEATKDFRRSGVDANTVDFTEQRKITARVLAETVIKSWDEEAFGEPFTIQAATDAMINVPSFIEFVQTEAGRDAAYRSAGIERSSGN